MTGGNTPKAWQFGSYFTNLTEGGACAPVAVDAQFWTEGIMALAPGRLVSVIDSPADWPNWEMHPQGDEFILLLSGDMTLIIGEGDAQTRVRLEPGHFTIVPRGCWHTADVAAASRAMFITPGEGTQGRAR